MSKNHALAARETLRGKELAGRPVILLARREGAGSHDTIIAACRQAGFSPDIAHTPSLMGTILKYVEAGAGIGIVPESAISESAEVTLIPLQPKDTIQLVLVWSKEAVDPAAEAFRELVLRWHAEGRLQPGAGEGDQ